MTKRKKALAFPKAEPRLVGTHQGCGGEVFYQTTASAGYYVCRKCRANGLFTQVLLDEKPSSGGTEPSGT